MSDMEDEDGAFGRLCMKRVLIECGFAMFEDNVAKEADQQLLNASLFLRVCRQSNRPVGG
jgi:hypothetical protein